MSPIRVSMVFDEEDVEWLDKEVEKERFGSRAHGLRVALKHLRATIEKGEPLQHLDEE